MMTTLKLSKAILLKGLPVYQETTVINGSAKNFATGRLYTHDVTEIALIEDGKGVHQIGNQEIPCKKGDIYIVHANTLHGYFADEQQDLKIRRLWFNVGDYFDGEVADFGDKRFCYGAFADGPLTSCARLNAIEQDKITKTSKRF